MANRLTGDHFLRREAIRKMGSLRADRPISDPNRPPPKDPSFVEGGTRRPWIAPANAPPPSNLLDPENRELEQRYSHMRPIPPTPAHVSPSPEPSSTVDPTEGRSSYERLCPSTPPDIRHTVIRPKERTSREGPEVVHTERDILSVNLRRSGAGPDHLRPFGSLSPDNANTYAMEGRDFEVWIMPACLKSALPHTRLFGARRRLVAKGSSARYRSQESPPHAKPLRVVASSHLS